MIYYVNDIDFDGMFLINIINWLCIVQSDTYRKVSKINSVHREILSRGKDDTTGVPSVSLKINTRKKSQKMRCNRDQVKKVKRCWIGKKSGGGKDGFSGDANRL